MGEAEQIANLARMRIVATALLLLMALLLVVARRFQPAYEAMSYVAAFAEAAMVGGLADWFAVTALFRHPFGLPIPHTAIIPKNKDRIGESIGNFLQYNFMTQEVLREELAHVDFAGSTAAWLADPANRRGVARHITEAIPAVLRTAEDKEVSAFAGRMLAAALADVRFGPLLGRVLEVLVAGQQHFILLQRILGIVARAFDQHGPYIRQKVHENSPRWLPRAVDEQFFVHLMAGVQSFLVEIQTDEEWRARFEAATQELIGKLSTSPEYERKLGELVARGLGHPLFHAYLDAVWAKVKERLLSDAASPASQAEARIEQLLATLGQALEHDASIRHRINGWLRVVVADTIVDRRDVIASVVWRVIRKWDAETVARKFELQVGSDLQYIRINGTVVGGMVGVILHAGSRWS
jgi:uncharacterized membrane-anchored protein YjiN (DUF445 family)